MDEFKHALDNVEDMLRRLGGLYKFTKTASPDVFCSALPSHWRSNKSLPQPFTVLILYPVPDGTKVTVAAGNEENSCADIKNNITEVSQQMARFNDLRFVGKSGRGKNFNLTITVHTAPYKEVVMANNIIKVTVDGPRDSRNPNKHILNDRKRPGLPMDNSCLGFSFLAKQARFGVNPFSMVPSNRPTMVPPLPLPGTIPSALYESFMAAAAMSALCGSNAANSLGNILNPPRLSSTDTIYPLLSSGFNSPANPLHALNVLANIQQKHPSKPSTTPKHGNINDEESGTPTSSSEANDSIESKLPQSRYTPDLKRITEGNQKCKQESAQELIHVDVETTTDDECNTSSASTSSSSLVEHSPSRLLKKEKDNTVWRPFSPKTVINTN